MPEAADYAEILEREPLFKLIGEEAEKLSAPAYVVGGFVRDILLERASTDIDVVCVGSGMDLATAVANRLGDTKVNYFKNFGTAMLRHEAWEVEFVGARKESYRSDSRKPTVENGTLEDDQNRRDFTINALAISLMPDNFGELIDPFGGQEHLKKKLVKTPLAPEITFSDDPLRMMRAVRFASQLNFDIDADAFAAIQQQAHRLEIVSQERIIAELNKIMLSPVPSYGFKLLLHAGLLELIFPEFMKLRGVEHQEGKGHKDNFYHTLQVLDNVAERSNDLWLRWAAILHDIAKPATKRFVQGQGWTFHGHEDKGARMVPKIFNRLKLPLNEHMRYVQKLVRLHLRPIALVKDTITDSAIRRLIYEAGNDLDDLLVLCRADITSKNKEKVKRYLRNFDKLEKRIAEVEETDKLRNFQPVVTGEVVMQLFGIGPGRQVGQLKTAVREAILDGKIKNTIEEAMPYLVQQAAQQGLKPKAE
jgi:putative nucleotidyltransferase with HDIG domain